MAETLEARSLAPQIPVNYGMALHAMDYEHADGLMQILEASPRIQAYITWTAGIETVDDIRRAIDERFPQKGEAPYVLLRGADVIGYTGLRDSKHRAGEYEIGYFIAADERGRGHIPAAVSALMSAAENQLEARGFALYVEDRNLPSLAVASKLGFVATGELREDTALGSIERRHERIVV